MDVMFPVKWRFGDNPTDGIGGPAVDDAGTVYIVRDEEQNEDWPNGNYEAPMLVKKTTLAEMVAYCLEGWRTDDGYTEDAHVPASDALAAALRAAADMLDAGKRPNVSITLGARASAPAHRSDRPPGGPPTR